MGDAINAWLDELGRLRSAKRPCTVVTVTGTQGSTPRDAGARMIVDTDGVSWGTIGGGRLEQLAVEKAQEMLNAAQPAATSERFPLGAKAGQCCGGEVTLFFESFLWLRKQVVVFGAGHVGQALGGLAPWLGADMLLIDSRTKEELIPRLPADAPFETRFVDAPEGELRGLRPGSPILIMTHSHALDLEILAEALRTGPHTYLGLIGSERKWARFQKQLARMGFDAAQIDSVRCPIGAGATSKEPNQIALSVAAELSTVLR
jgi:xanthine dehydrogenase accessory factor